MPLWPGGSDRSTVEGWGPSQTQLPSAHRMQEAASAVCAGLSAVHCIRVPLDAWEASLSAQEVASCL